ncbi:MAG: hypothetical protein GY710_16025, partial [Desulfobacteraceae bacterium]|nr:hypothetical protein [Desulfobacteraceae bacterium]
MEPYIDDRQQSGDQVEDRQQLMEPYIDAGSSWNLTSNDHRPWTGCSSWNLTSMPATPGT